MSGTEKFPLFWIEKSGNASCFNGLTSLLVAYENNKKAWTTSAIFGN